MTVSADMRVQEETQAALGKSRATTVAGGENWAASSGTAAVEDRPRAATGHGPKLGS